MYLAYRGITVLILAPLLALFAVLASGSAPLMATYTQVFMEALGGYVIVYFPLFLLGAIFGSLFQRADIPKRLLPSVSTPCSPTWSFRACRRAT